ncbi:MAG TPA: hypothetical protein VF188_14920 [Longimicrobiales bacterium]
MFVRPHTAVFLASSVYALRVGALAAMTTTDPVRLVVENDTYASLEIALVDASGRERPLGQAPPDFTNTLSVSEPLPEGEVRFIARLAGEEEVIYRSESVRVVPGMRIRWRLPANVIET